jgi:hypothetical protein
VKVKKLPHGHANMMPSVRRLSACLAQHFVVPDASLRRLLFELGAHKNWVRINHVLGLRSSA